MELLREIVLTLALAAVVVLVCSRLRVPAIIGFILAGVAVGPSALGIAGNTREIEVLSEIGIVLLLFTVGLEFSFKGIQRIGAKAYLGGLVQMLLAAGACALLWRAAAGSPWGESAWLGAILSMSSTAIVLKLLGERAEIETPHGAAAVAILLFQDLMIVPLMLAVNVLGRGGAAAAGQDSAFAAPLVAAAKIAGVSLLVAAGSRWAVPAALRRIARTRNRELFVLGVVVICALTAWLSAAAGLSLAVGAFLAGLMIAESEYGRQALSVVLPLRDIFLSFFFISIGMLLDLGALSSRLPLIAGLAAAVVAAKAVTAAAAAAVAGAGARTSALVGLLLGNAGEFSILLAGVGVSAGLLGKESHAVFLGVAVLTMIASPFAVMAGGPLGRLAAAWEASRKSRRRPGEETADEGEGQAAAGEDVGKGLLLIVGFGMNGRRLAQLARDEAIPYSIVEMNPDTVREGRAQGLPIHFGDAIHDEVLRHAGAAKARVAVVAINDPVAARRIVELLRRVSGGAHIVARARFAADEEELRRLGADEVVVEEREAADRIHREVTRKYGR